VEDQNGVEFDLGKVLIRSLRLFWGFSKVQGQGHPWTYVGHLFLFIKFVERINPAQSSTQTARRGAANLRVIPCEDIKRVMDLPESVARCH
jgi:hypothetical protein